MLYNNNRHSPHLQQLEQQQQHIIEHATHGSHIYAANVEEEDKVANQLEHDVNLNFTTFNELCRLCAIHEGATKLHLFESEAEQRQLLFKLRTLLQSNVSIQHATCNGV